MEKKRKTPLKNEKTSKNQALHQKSYQKNTYFGSTPCNIFGTILKMVLGGIQTNETKDKKVNDHADGLTSERWHRQSLGAKNRRSKRTRQHWRLRRWINTRNREHHKKKPKEKLITTANNSICISPKKKKKPIKTRKQGWEEKQPYDFFKRQTDNIAHMET